MSMGRGSTREGIIGYFSATPDRDDRVEREYAQWHAISTGLPAAGSATSVTLVNRYGRPDGRFYDRKQMRCNCNRPTTNGTVDGWLMSDCRRRIRRESFKNKNVVDYYKTYIYVQGDVAPVILICTGCDSRFWRISMRVRELRDAR